GIPAKIFQCPSDTRSDIIFTGPPPVALTGYKAVHGRNQFKETYGQDGIMYVNGGTKMSSISDGTSNTLLVGEVPPSVDLYYGWMWAGSGDSPYFGTTDIALGVREIVPKASDCPGSGCPNPGVSGQNPANFQLDFYRPGALVDPGNLHRYHYWSLHPNGGMWL